MLRDSDQILYQKIVETEQKGIMQVSVSFVFARDNSW